MSSSSSSSSSSPVALTHTTPLHAYAHLLTAAVQVCFVLYVFHELRLWAPETFAGIPAWPWPTIAYATATAALLVTILPRALWEGTQAAACLARSSLETAASLARSFMPYITILVIVAMTLWFGSMLLLVRMGTQEQSAEAYKRLVELGHSLLHALSHWV